MDPCADHLDPRLRPPSGPAAGACLPAQQTSSLTSSSPSCPARHLPAQQTPSPTRPAAFPPTPEARVAGAGVRSAARRVPDLGLPGAQGGAVGRRKPLPLSSIPVPTHRQASPPQHVPPAPRPRPVRAPSAPRLHPRRVGGTRHAGPAAPCRRRPGRSPWGAVAEGVPRRLVGVPRFSAHDIRQVPHAVADVCGTRTFRRLHGNCARQVTLWV